MSSFVGRQQERGQLAELLAAQRLVTLTGEAGIGKSRLALEAARTVGEANGWRLAYADLAAEPPTAAMPDLTDLTALGADLAADLKDDNPYLLVLDNADHVVEPCRRLAADALASCPGLRIMVTSRQRLRPTGDAGDRAGHHAGHGAASDPSHNEVVWPVPPLSTPAKDGTPAPEDLLGYDAVALFVVRAKALQSQFEVNDNNARAIVDICRPLEGNPLALELAAARIGVLSVAEIAEHLDDLFTVLAGEATTAAPRHRSLHAAITWTHQLLSEPEKALLRRLSVFAGGFTFEAAKGVCAGEPVNANQVAAILDRLTATSLAHPFSAAGRARFRLSEITRRYAHDRLIEAGEEADRRGLHAAWCVVALDEANRAMHHDDHTSVKRLEAEYDNVCAAVQWAVDQGRAKLTLRLARGQMLFWQISGRYGEAREWLQRVLTLASEAPAPLRASALHDAGYVALVLGDFPAARSYLEESLELFSKWPHSKAQSSARTMLAFAYSFNAGAESLQRLGETLAHARVTGDDLYLAESLVAYGRARLFRGGAAVAQRHFGEAVEVARRLADDGITAHAAIGLGSVALLVGRWADAQGHLDRGISCARHLADAHITAVGVSAAGDLARRRGDNDAARRLLGESREVARRMATPYPLATSLVGLGRLALAEGDAPGAEPLFDEALSLARVGLPYLVAPAMAGVAQVRFAAGDAGSARSVLDEALRVAYDHGDAWGTAEVLHARGRVARSGAHYGRAASFHHQALGVQHEIGDAPGVVASIEALAGLTAIDGGAEAAAVVFGAAAALRAAYGYPRSPLEVDTYAADVALVEKALGGESFEAAWAQGASLTLDEAVSYASSGGARRPRPTTGWASLTPTECEVAALVEEGLTNREIAQRLLLSAETVKSHLSKIFTKLDVSSRQELAHAVGQRTREPRED